MKECGLFPPEEALGIAMACANLGFWELTAENASQTIRMDGNAAAAFGLSGEARTMDFARLAEAFHPDDRARVQAEIRELLAQPDAEKQMEYRVLHGASQQWRWVRSAGRSRGGEQPGRRVITGVVQDMQDSLALKAATDQLSVISRQADQRLEEIRRMQAELRVAREAAEESTRSKGEFLAKMSHEIRTPMNAIKGLAELLSLTPLTQMQLGYVQNIVKSSNTLLSIINDVLDFSKINTAKVELVESAYSLENLIAEVSNGASMRASEKGLMLLLEVSPSLPCRLIGDDVRVKQVMINLLNNAVKYTREGHVILRLTGGETDKGFELVCTVEDTGMGIKEEDIPFLFEAFTQADRHTTHHIQGTGLGLPICNQLVQTMGGSIAVESELGRGSVFTVRFPQGVDSNEPLATVERPEGKRVLLMAREARARSIAAMLDGLHVAHTPVTSEDGLAGMGGEGYTHCLYDDSFSDVSVQRIRRKEPDCLFVALKDMRYAMGQSGNQDAVLFLPLLVTELAKALKRAPESGEADRCIDDFALSGVHILVVDDNEINLVVAGELLRAYKAEVTCAESGQRAVELCEEMLFDLIFMDHMMPGMDGIETTIALRGGGGLNRATPIVALTANVVSDLAEDYLKAGMDDFIGKPIEISDMSRVLLQWLPQSKITTMRAALQPEESADQPLEDSMERLIQSLDTFGMYVSDVMREIDNDYGLFIQRMARVRSELSPMVVRLREEVRAENWEVFAGDVAEMASMIHDVGARDCSGRARKLAAAGREGNAEYIKGDFYSLMDNMYMLEKKMEVAVPLALGTISANVPFGDIRYCYDRLADMEGPLVERDYETCVALLDSLAHYSLDHDLDMILVKIGVKLAEGDFAGASLLRGQAAQHCVPFLDER